MAVLAMPERTPRPPVEPDLPFDPWFPPARPGTHYDPAVDDEPDEGERHDDRQQDWYDEGRDRTGN